jgi:SAM-dependent methyltransferase
MTFADENFDQLSKTSYEKQFLLHGATPEGVYWVGSERQELRFQLLLKAVFEKNGLDNISIADVGCGYGALADYINKTLHNKKLRYFGYDISERLIGQCNDNISYSWASFKVGKYPHKQVDYCIMSGTYNLAMTNSIQEWEDYIFQCLNACWQQTRISVIFNLQIAPISYISNGKIFYANKKRTLVKCKSLYGPTTIVQHPSLTKDAMFIVKKS